MVAVTDPARAQEFNPADWRTAISTAYLTKMMGVLQCVCSGLDLPNNVRRWFDTAETRLAFSHKMFALDLRDIQAFFSALGIPTISLKGGAYRALELPWSIGRISSDLDILVPWDRLSDAERALREADWEDMLDETSALDREYFRQWLHEIPPLKHPERFVSLDVHHNILPRTDPKCFDPERLWASAVQAPNGLLVPCPPDMVIHSAVHLLRNGRFHHGIRDLHDIHCLITTFGHDPDFWPSLLDRAREVRLTPTLGLGLRYASILFGTRIPDDVTPHIQAHLPRATALIDRLVANALLPRTLHRIDYRREFAIWTLAHLPPPRLRVLASPLFWRKRLARPEPAAAV